MFHAAMITSGVGKTTAKIMYGAVYHWGPRWTEMDSHNALIADIPVTLPMTFTLAPFGKKGGLKSGKSALIALTFEEKKAPAKKRAVDFISKSAPKLERRPPPSEEDLVRLKESLRTQGEDLESIERQVDAMFGRK
jgi:hypothetical protein